MADLPVTIGKHTVLGELGRGGMGRVLLAHDPDLDREVAIKLLDGKRFIAPDARARFLREARALAKLNDPRIVQVFEFMPDGDQPWLVMERLKGRTLRQVLAEGGRFNAGRLTDCAWQVLRGLSVAHGAGIVHRDLKPTNLMLVEGGLYKILDFGLAEGLGDPDLTEVGEVVGTLRYLPPERRRGIESGPVGDLWSLGTTLVELACDNLPPDGAVPHLPGFDAGLIQWLRRMTAAEPGDRFASAADALAALPMASAAVLPLPGAVAPSTSTTDNTRILPTTVGTGTGSRTSTLRPRPLLPLVRSPTTRRLGLPFVVKLILVIWIISTAATLFAGWAIASRAMEVQEQRLRQELTGIAASAALMIDGPTHGRLAQDPTSDPIAIERMRATLERFRAVHPEVRYIYTMAPRSDTAKTGVVRFICDASREEDANHNGVIDPGEARATPGQDYPAKDAPALLAGFETAGTDGAPLIDQWGSWWSGYAPIRRSDGSSVGLVGVDLPAGHIEVIRRDFMIHSVILMASTLVAFLAAGTLVAFRLRRPVTELTRGMQALANGDLDAPIDIRSRDEFQLLAEVFERMRVDLRRAAAVRGAFEAFLTRSVAGESGHHQSTSIEDARLCIQLRSLSGQSGMAERLTEVMPRLFAHAQAQGGLPERVVGHGILFGFPHQGGGDLPQERAVRAALAALADLQQERGLIDLAAGVALGSRAGAQAEELSRAGLASGFDLLISTDDYHAIRPAFYADRVALPALGDVVCVKGAVSAL